MRIDENTIVWHEVEATPATLAEIFRDKQVLSCEPVDYPMTDALVFALTDLSQVVFVEVAVSEDLLYAGPSEDVVTPLVVRVSEPVQIPAPDGARDFEE